MCKFIFQVLAALIMHFSCLTLGLMFTWPSSVLLLFKSEETPLHRRMTETELSLLGSLFSAGALVSNPLVGTYLDKFGRKKSAIVIAGFGTIAWSIIAVSNRVELILIAVFVSGVSASIFLVVPVFVSEICDESIRGSLTSGALALNGLGILLSYLIGGLLSYRGLVYVCLTLSLIGVLLLMLLKESPMLLMKKGLDEEAKKSIAFYKNTELDSKIVLQEVHKIKRLLSAKLQETQTAEEEKLTSKIQDKVPAEKLGFFQFMRKSKSSQRALIVSLTLMTLGTFQGMLVVLVYAKPLFTEAVPEEIMTPMWCSVVLAIVSVVAGFVAAYLTDLTGRRTLLIYSSLASGLCCIGLGTQIHIHWGPQWLTAVFIYLFCAVYTFGGGTIPYVLLAELFLPEVKSVISMIALEWTWLCNFVALFIFNPLVAAIGLGPNFYMFAVICIGTAVFCFFFLPETKGLPADAVQLLLVKPNRNHVV